MDWFTRLESERSKTISVERRRTAAALLRELVGGRITNDELEDGWPVGPGDPALNGVFDFVWLHYDDLWTHRFQGTEEAATALLRCARFLESDLPYVWLKPPWIVRLVSFALNLVTFGFASRMWNPPPGHWPFPSEETATPSS